MPAVAALADDADAGAVRGRTQIWAENCARCHNQRPMRGYNTAQREIVMHHMRVRANLTGDEQQRILEMLDSRPQ
jgi:hypothetical protein